ncbi:unnamed protein product, partial [Brassica oleracea]
EPTVDSHNSSNDPRELWLYEEVSDTSLLHRQQLSGLQFRWDREHHRDVAQPPDHRILR